MCLKEDRLANLYAFVMTQYHFHILTSWEKVDNEDIPLIVLDIFYHTSCSDVSLEYVTATFPDCLNQVTKLCGKMLVEIAQVWNDNIPGQTVLIR